MTRHVYTTRSFSSNIVPAKLVVFLCERARGSGQAATGFTAQKNRQLRRLDQTMVVLETSNVRLDKHDVE